jgi:hypothetical protein
MDKDKKEQAESKARKKLIIREEALREMALEDEQLAHVIGGELPGPGIPGQPNSPTGGP